MKIGRFAGVTDTGRRRMRNEDTLVIRPPLFAVADGMGGAKAGEIAARLAASALEEAGTGVEGEQGVAALIEEANRRIWERAVADPATAGMGTTVTAALVDAQSAAVAIGHVGDSRAYLLRGETFAQLSTDHSLVAELVQSGVLTPEEAERHPQRSAITRALGTDAAVDVEVQTIEGQVGDLFVLCSDGLSVMLGDEEIVAAIEGAGREPQAAGDALVAAANTRGGEDNITVVLFELVDGEPEPPQLDAGSDPSGQTPSGGTGTDSRSDPTGLTSSEPSADVRTHGAGPGGRLTSLALVALAIAVGLLALYWGISR
ncbi:MAG TPA: Stp1/IreP family PP2C-type Ser/Thr phosphatase [Gaiellaceae bacterium]|nr:Stp1/IreP family PP2C-type Ser/Thr phosphatase [Gaiellaceae bacterium]